MRTGDHLDHPGPTFNPARWLGSAGGAMGLLAGLAISSQRLGLINLNPGVEPRPGPSVELAGNLGFLFAFTMPFALALIALLFRNPSWRIAVWLGVAVLALAAAFAPLSIVTCLALPLPGMLLALAAALTWRETRSRDNVPMLIVAGALALLGGLAGILLFSLPDAQCWLLSRDASGQAAWQSIPFTNSLTIGPGTGATAGTCASDIISPIEAVMSAGVWVLTLIGLDIALPRALPRAAG